MPKNACLLAIDQGTTSTRSLLFSASGRLIFTAQREHSQSYPQPGWVEHDPREIWYNVLHTAREAIAIANAPVAGIGIANQRETTVIWERATGAPIYPAIVWQDRRTAANCEHLRQEGAGPLIRARTGLLLDPYFSATKIAWILENVEGARARAERGELAFGTIDSFLLWHLTGGTVHATDAANASRTMLFDIRRQCWDEDLLRLFSIPASLLPSVYGNSFLFGVTAQGMFESAIPVAGMAGDQHAALMGQACVEPGMAKATYGTGCFVLFNMGEAVLLKRQVMLTGEYIIDASSGLDSVDNRPAVFITLDGKGARILSRATRDKVGRPMATVFIETKIDKQKKGNKTIKVKKTVEEVINIATIREQLGKRFQITGLDSTEEARNLALLLRAGALAAPISIIEERTVGPSLGQDNITMGYNASLIGFALVLVFTAIYYGVFGLVADLALMLNLVLLLALMSLLQATLTLPGIAGIVLTVGMAIDARPFPSCTMPLAISAIPRASSGKSADV
ncbi:MAG: SecD/SecF family protein translocase subunit, partial [Beijerinckiaceae bacterium]|nr:SecD/SecF family protein translocase subunit [Beijerinckiaceae bacterium]